VSLRTSNGAETRRWRFAVTTKRWVPRGASCFGVHVAGDVAGAAAGSAASANASARRRTAGS
jgi:hypothetical protein